jgi:hypothetical protein
MGGCAHHAMSSNLHDDRCSTFRYEHRERVLQFIESIYFTSTRRPSTTEFIQTAESTPLRRRFTVELPIVTRPS